MNFIEHLQRNNLLDERIAGELYGLGNNYLKSITARQIIDGQRLYSEASKYYNMALLPNSLDLKVSVDKSKKLGDLETLIERQTLVFEYRDKLYFLIDNPDDFVLIEKVRSIYPDICLSLVSDSDREAVVKRLIQPLEIGLKARKISEDSLVGSKLNDTRYQSEAQRLYHIIINAALENRASDLHIIPTRKEAKILFRIDGKVMPYIEIPLNILPNLKNILCNEAKVGIQQNVNVPIEGKAIYRFREQSVDIRINIIPAKLGFDINLRFLSDELKDIYEIGYSEENIKVLQDLFAMTKGLVVITGPTGSGKTTTLYAALSDLKKGDRKILTLEDPVEITLEGITQIDISKENGFGYDRGVAGILRHDPDITLIGETRTSDVAEEVIKLADTGHLAITTMHTRDSLSAVSRFYNLGISPYALGDVLAAVIAQRLVRRICLHCKEEYSLDQGHPWREMFNLGEGEIILARGKGCSHCDGRGYFGRLAIAEFLIITHTISSLIQKQENRYSILSHARDNGFKTMLEDGVQKALGHLTTLDELEQIAKDIL